MCLKFNSALQPSQGLSFLFSHKKSNSLYPSAYTDTYYVHKNKTNVWSRFFVYNFSHISSRAGHWKFNKTNANILSFIIRTQGKTKRSANSFQIISFLVPFLKGQHHNILYLSVPINQINIAKVSVVLKGQCHEIFDSRFFSWIIFPQAPEYTIFENAWRYSQLKGHHGGKLKKTQIIKVLIIFWHLWVVKLTYR
jgi:hypothetical protein